jgi:hypothetical protein
MSQEIYQSKKGEIDAISDKDTLTPNIPVDTALQEGENLNVWCQDDKEALLKAGLNWKLVEDLSLRIAALRYIESMWQKDFKSKEEAQIRWAAESPAAYDLRDELVHHFYHAFYEMPDLYARTQRIDEGNTHADMIQDLSDLAALGKANTAPLKAKNIDLTLLDKAEKLSGEMAKLLAEANGKKMQDNNLLITRNKAYTFMKKAIDEIRRNGQYAFWKNPQRYKGYISIYHKKQAAKAAKPKVENTAL